jgi:hypothetical protein
LLGVPGLEAAGGGGEKLSEVELEAGDLTAKAEHLKVDPSLVVADVLVPFLACERSTAVRARHVLGMGKESEHHLINPSPGTC